MMRVSIKNGKIVFAQIGKKRHTARRVPTLAQTRYMNSTVRTTPIYNPARKNNRST
jgi:hypothetical protein